jgi:hypothetical protein
LVETSSTGGSAFPGDLRVRPRVCLYDRYARNAALTLAEKTSITSAELRQLVPGCFAAESLNN